jgi:hypothetical protein
VEPIHCGSEQAPAPPGEPSRAGARGEAAHGVEGLESAARLDLRVWRLTLNGESAGITVNGRRIVAAPEQYRWAVGQSIGRLAAMIAEQGGTCERCDSGATLGAGQPASTGTDANT